VTVIAIQSQVVHGHVGNSAAVFPLQTCGIEVATVPTTLLSLALQPPPNSSLWQADQS
jgi:pyridoxine kinase